MGNCGAKNVRREQKPMLKGKYQSENQLPQQLSQKNQLQALPNQEALLKTPEKKKQQCSYFVPNINLGLSDGLQKILKDLIGKVVVDELIQGKLVADIVGLSVGLVTEFNDLVLLNKELLKILYDIDVEKVKQLPQLDNFLTEVTKMKYEENHEKFVEFVTMMLESPQFYSFEKAIELERESIYLLVETFAALQVMRNDCYSNERRHWWHPVDVQDHQPLKEIEFVLESNLNVNSSKREENIVISDDYFDYYFDKFAERITNYCEYINTEKEFQKRIEEEEERQKQEEEEQRLKAEEEERRKQELYEQEEARLKKEKENNLLFEQEEELTNCRGVGDINNLQFHVKKQLIA